jgi:hypothetical protein
MRLLASGLLVLALAACNTISPKANSRLVVVDRSGTPIAGAVVEPVPDDLRAAATIENLSKYELKNWTTDAEGMIHNDLEEYYWDADSCYHFHVHRAGYEDFDISVSKELMPATYRIELRDRVPATP